MLWGLQLFTPKCHLSLRCSSYPAGGVSAASAPDLNLPIGSLWALWDLTVALVLLRSQTLLAPHKHAWINTLSYCLDCVSRPLNSFLSDSRRSSLRENIRSEWYTMRILKGHCWVGRTALNVFVYQQYSSGQDQRWTVCLISEWQPTSYNPTVMLARS